MGFCLLNNVAIAAAAARARGTTRTLVLDWDVHHGNGTQEMFWAMPDVLYVSLHQSPYYPGTGDADEVGSGNGRGYTVNVPLAAGADDAVYIAAFERVVLPIVEQYRPELTLISAGFDAHARDPLGGMLLSDGGFNELTRLLLRALPPERPVALLLEGGYDLQGLEGALLASLRAFGGAYEEKQRATPPNPLHERELLHALNVQRRYWYLG
jgi:acetoin utilization deacetylase AcuC-like enzyme